MPPIGSLSLELAFIKKQNLSQYLKSELEGRSPPASRCTQYVFTESPRTSDAMMTSSSSVCARVLLHQQLYRTCFHSRETKHMRVEVVELETVPRSLNTKTLITHLYLRVQIAISISHCSSCRFVCREVPKHPQHPFLHVKNKLFPAFMVV
ncbi:hypothetical protein JOB18_048593 [Solea senegalensis]|uniref:Uncharacterized protein n=1 Tax=Solea senegalensis TaxID=28829 RepID=A0AAV6R555_SOLSE|nr:hypothetical protein JOB18_048593 [Solea senegalensis]